MPVLRAFIALELSAEISQRLDQISAELKQRVPLNTVRWVPARNIHLTLIFLGDVSTPNLETLQKTIFMESGNFPPFEISIGGVGAFPSAHRPRVIWVGVTAPEILNILQQSIETGVSQLGYPRDERPFSPHLTLGRLTRNATPADLQRVGEVLRGYNIGFLGTVQVQAVHLFRSELSPTGARYTRMFSAPLNKLPFNQT